MMDEKADMGFDGIVAEEKLEVGRLYRIVRIADDVKPNPEEKREMYVGATADPVDTRMIEHKSASKDGRDYPLHIVMQREGVDNFRIEQITEYKNITRRELYHEEAKLIESFNTVKGGWNGKYGSPFCVHGKNRRVCVPCLGSAICKHMMRREYCKTCNGTATCEHGRFKANCIPCGGVNICEHFKRRSDCRFCRQCPCCPFDEKHGVACNMKHLNKRKHRHNWRIYQMCWTSDVAQTISGDDRHDFVMSMMMNSDQMKSKFARIDNHRFATVHSASIPEIETLINRSVPLADIPLHKDDHLSAVQPEKKKMGRKTGEGGFVPTGDSRDCKHGGREENCLICNPCRECNGAEANSARHRESNKHKENVVKFLAAQAGNPIGKKCIGHKIKSKLLCPACNPCVVCPGDHPNYGSHITTQRHKTNLAKAIAAGLISGA